MSNETHDPLGAMFARMETDPYAPILSAALLVQAEIDCPAREMALWTGPYRNDGRARFDHATARMKRERDDLLDQHPATPVVRAVEDGLRERKKRIEAEKVRQQGISALVSSKAAEGRPYLRDLADIKLSLDNQIRTIDHMGIAALSPVRRHLDQAREEIMIALIECKAEEVAA